MGKTETGVDVVDDYAHHPTEIKTTLETAKKNGIQQCFGWLFSPTLIPVQLRFLEQFASALKTADRVMITDIYPARENMTEQCTPAIWHGLYRALSI